MAKQKPSLGREHDLLRVAFFVLFDALLLCEAHAQGQEIGRASPLALRTRLLKVWGKRSGDVGAEPLLDLAKTILAALPHGSATEQILQILAAAARETAQSGLQREHDVVGRVYHKLLLSTAGHHYATYYTSLAAAQLLANLVFQDLHPNWDSALRDFRVMDPACGSGTLLSAAYKAIRDRCAEDSSADTAKLHEALLENVLHGWDVVDFAVLLARATLSLHSQDGTPKGANITTKPLGVEDGRVRLGSLDALGCGQQERDRFDVVLMNPPFSRSAKPNIKFGYGEPEQRKAMNAALQRLARKHCLRKASVAGLTPFFMRLALDILKKNGRVGMVVPRSTLSGVGSEGIRRKFEERTKLGIIVSNFDPGSARERVDGWSWSENTDLGEVLITAENAPDRNERHLCTFLNVYQRPRNQAEALALSEAAKRASKLVRGTLLQGHHKEIKNRRRLFGVIYRLPQAQLQGNWLKGCTFADPALNRLCLNVLSHAAMRPLRDFVKIVNNEHAFGRDIATIKPNFSACTGAAEARIVMGHQSGMNTLELDAVHVRNARPKSLRARRMFQEFASTLLVAERPHLFTESLLAMRTSERVVATAFWEVQAQPGAQDWLLLWLNSTYGVMTFLASATSSQADIFKMKKDQLKNLPVPVPTRVGELRALFRRLRRQSFARYAAEFRLAANGAGARVELDRFFASALGLPKLTDGAYCALSRDPPVSRKAVMRPA